MVCAEFTPSNRSMTVKASFFMWRVKSGGV